ncbi:MAG TPA: anti-sigma factor [Thermomicrobiales bacterium]|nr:anti-sigma factor [Thermomicrobiales bacterium]
MNETSEGEDLDTDGHVNRLLAGYALGALDRDEMELVARHVQGCVSCRAELAELESVTGLLAYAVPPLPVPVRARAGLLAKLDAVGTTNAEQMVVLRRPARSPGDAFPAARVRRFAAFVALPIVMVLAVVLVMGEIISDQQDELRTTQEEKNDSHRVLTSAGVDDPRFMTDFVTVPNVGGAAMGRLFLDWEANTAMIVAKDMPAIGEQQQYVVWFRLQEPHEYARAGVLQIDAQGRTQLTLEPADPIMAYEALVITIELDADAASPAGPEVMTAGMLPENLQVVP